MRFKGTIGEMLAKDFLIKTGFIILKQNMYTRFGELDIIAKKMNRVHVIEVKLLQQEYFNLGYKINRKKKQRMIKSTQIIIDRLNLTNLYFQFDLITIIGNQIKHLENIFSLTDV